MSHVSSPDRPTINNAFWPFPDSVCDRCSGLLSQTKYVAVSVFDLGHQEAIGHIADVPHDLCPELLHFFEGDLDIFDVNVTDWPDP